ncbi:MAG TPA: TRAP transporter substrate-binding protein [Rhizomicrobium sp.]
MARSISRKAFLAGAVATATAPMIIGAARAVPKTIIKFGVDVAPDNPTTLHAIAAGKEIAKATNGEVTVQVFPNSELGDDTHMIASVRSGAIQMMGIGDNILATLVPSCAIDNMGFAFKDSQNAWDALDGEVGTLVRADIENGGLFAMRKIWDDGFRQITSGTHPIKTVDDLKDFKTRVPPSPISLSLFKDLGAAPGVLNLAEVYTALQTKVYDGQENPLSFTETQKFYQVQKYCSMTDHMWNGRWLIVNGPFWNSLPADHQKAVADGFDGQAALQRSANQQLNDNLKAKLESQGLVFNTPDKASFRAKLVSSGFYTNWKAKFTPQLWSALETYTGALA